MSTKNQLVKQAAARNARETVSLRNAIRHGNPGTWISLLIMGFGNLINGQILKGLLFAALEAGFFVFLFLPKGGLYWLSCLFPLVHREDQLIMIDHPVLGQIPGEVVTTGEFSQVALLYGVATVVLCAVFVFFWYISVRSGYQALMTRRAGNRPNTFRQDIRDLFDSKIQNLLMTPAIVGLLVFTVLPLLYMMCMAFTNYDRNHLDNNFDWVGLKNFANILSFNSSVGKQFWNVLAWTLVWAFFATFLNFFLGTFVAIIINRPTTRLKGLWRGCLSITIAVPQFVSLLLMKQMLADQGIVNRMLQSAGYLADGAFLPFLTQTTWARVTVIVINLWVGIPYTIMQVTGILKNIPGEQYEAARIDGANAFQQFKSITLPYMLFVMTPYIITSFTGNINNFNVIYLLSTGNPTTVGNTAGDTDLLVTWLYKLSVDFKDYNIGAVVGILTFIVLAGVSLLTYHSSGSYKDEEGFR